MPGGVVGPGRVVRKVAAGIGVADDCGGDSTPNPSSTRDGVSVPKLCGFVPETDDHEALLTVRETLQFAADSCIAAASLPPGVTTARLVELTME